MIAGTAERESMNCESLSLAPDGTDKTDTGAKYLTFSLANEWYGINVLHVREIIHTSCITAVPQMPAHVRGVINLRGRIIPVTDLRIKFGLPSTRKEGHTSVVVVQTSERAGAAQMGLVVDTLEEVLNICLRDIEGPPDSGISTHAIWLHGLAKVKGRVIILLDLARVLDTAYVMESPSTVPVC
jgi:purine-binding chemotaxis protein CheW